MNEDVREHVLRGGDALVLVAPDGRAGFSTPRARALLGVGGGDVPTLEELEATGVPSPIDLRTLAADVEGRRVQQVRGANGSVLDVVALATDTDELAVFLAPARGGAPFPTSTIPLLEKVLQTTRDAVLVTTAEPFHGAGPIIVYANDALEHHTGWSVDELLGRSPRVLQGIGTDRTELNRLDRELERWHPVTSEVLNYRKDGSPFWVEIDVVPLADDSGWFTHWVSVQRDVTERHERESRTAADLAFTQRILDSLPAQTVMLDGAGRIVAVNEPWREAWTRGTHAPQPQWSGMDYLAACADADARPESDEGAAVRAGIVAVLSGRADSYSHDYECWVDEDLHWFHLQVVPLTAGEGAVVTHTDITARKRAEADLSHQATHDSLTGLPNRDLLRERLATELERGRARGTATAVLFIDLDNFKDINDAYGHVYGDQVLDTVGERLMSVVRRQDTVARIGGDEYVVLVVDVDPGWDHSTYLARVRDAVCEPVALGVADIRPSMSIGVVISPPHLGDVDAVLRDADTAMYAAKRSGRDRWELFTPAVRDEALVRALSEDRMAAALAQDGFVLHYQPVVALSTGITVGDEALLRLKGPDGTLLFPGQFLVALESGPLAEDVGAWVLDRALAQQARWAAARPDHVVGINVSPRQLGHGRFLREVEEALERHGIPPANLMLEITEEVVASTRAANELRALKELGVRLAVDDFGTGYSSLSYLAHLPVDVLKVDRSFLVQSDLPGGRALLAAIIGVAAAVGALVNVEGVETHEQLALVRELGADAVQGYLLGRPATPADEPRSPEVDWSSLPPV